MGSAPNTPTHFGFQPYLEGLRGVAIILVIVGHLIPQVCGVTIKLLAGLGVNVFFVLSGFLITSILISEEARTGKISLRQFYRRRIYRIFPAFYLFVLFVGVLIFAGLCTDPALDLVVSGLFLRNIFGHGNYTGLLWSISLEEQFYFLWPSALFVFGSRNILKKAIVTVCAIILWRTLAIHFHVFSYESGVFTVRSDFRLDSILSGCIISLAYHSSELKPLLKKLTIGWIAPLVFVAMLGWAIWGETLTSLLPFYLTLINILTAYFFLCLVCREQSLMRKLLSVSWLRWVGKVSFSLYLWHLSIALVEPFASFPVWTQIGLGVLVASLSYYCVETPFLKLKDKRAEKRKGEESPKLAAVGV